MSNESRIGQTLSHKLDHNYYRLEELGAILRALHEMYRAHNSPSLSDDVRSKISATIDVMEDKANLIWDEILASLDKPTFRQHWGSSDPKTEIVRLNNPTRFDQDIFEICAPVNISTADVEKKLWMMTGTKRTIMGVSDKCSMGGVERIHYVCTREPANKENGGESS